MARVHRLGGASQATVGADKHKMPTATINGKLRVGKKGAYQTSLNSFN